MYAAALSCGADLSSAILYIEKKQYYAPPLTMTVPNTSCQICSKILDKNSNME